MVIQHEKISNITQAILQEEINLKIKYPALNYQNFIGVSIFSLVVTCFLSLALCFHYQVTSAWLTVVLLALVTSIAHEIEHDLIHKQYVKQHKLIENTMMFTVWLFRPNTVNPWYRRKLHLNHHKVSGTKQDLEERLVGNGETNIVMRLLAISDGLLGLLFRANIFKKEVTDFKFFSVFNAGAPLATCYFILLYSFILMHVVNYFDPTLIPALISKFSSSLPSNILYWFNFTVVVFVLPNVIRSACLNFVTSSMHYYGGVNSLLHQTQVLTHWVFVPFQCFCFNFGQSHSIHHFVPNQPFYIRQLISKRLHGVLKENGVRFNDFSTMFTGNYYKSN